MARRLVDAGHQVTMVCGRHDGCVTGLTGAFKKGMRRGHTDGIDVIEFDLPYGNSSSFAQRTLVFLKFAFRSAHTALFTPCDLIFATTTPLTAGIPGILARTFRRVPFVFEVRDLWPELPKAMGVIRNPIILQAMSVLEWACYKSADHLIALAGGIADGIAARGVSRDRITTIPNGCDLDIFGYENKSWRPPEIDEGDFLALYAGTHGIANGLYAVLDAAAELKRRGRTDMKFLLVGSGRCKSELVAQAKTSGLSNVIFLDPVPKDRLAQLMRTADLGMQILDNVPAFYHGTSPNKFFDYIAASLPVLNNYPGWVAELIAEYRCGFAVPPGDAQAFADALEEAAADKTALRTKGRAALGLAESRFDRRILSGQFVDCIEQVPR